MTDDHALVFSDDEDDSDNGYNHPEMQGVLSKWTNYIHGWQSRFIVLKDGTLSYYKSEQDTGFGCRGAISIYKATVKPHEFDECRFDVSVNDCVWYLRADNPEEKQQWVEVLEAHKAESGYGSENNLKRHGSAVSLTSNTLSTASTSSFKKGRGLKEKVAEIETFRDILCQQIDTLQQYFDACAETTPSLRGASGELQVADFKGEALTFKATAAGVIATLQHCVELVGQREEVWRRRMEREVEKRRKAEEQARTAASRRLIIHSSPDYEEGPHSALNDEEFYDAVETGLDRLEEEDEFRERLKNKSSMKPLLSKASQHPLWPEIDRITVEQLHYARLGVGEGGWQLFAEDGEMKMYKREEEVDGLVVDPLKACHVVKGVTGHEMCHYFFSPDYRMDWESTIEQMTVLEKVSEDTLIFLQVHKRIWPASQRDSLFWSHIRKVPDDKDRDSQDIWIVCNHSTDSSEFPANTSKCVRIYLTVCLVCQTLVDPPKDDAKITRDNITCKVTYCSVVNPGGWAPASVLRAVYKREYPKFLKRFTSYVADQCKDKPIMF
ncbi:ceramide transfer protein [Schistocerca gregaria]|uniref:ceramide transfer protein n=1 Tax=Schistocerca gregaria TaxID=7010 RepID=UPI00211DB92E|nr:ceramide transfer protein [Schistocerca gregaria]